MKYQLPKMQFEEFDNKAKEAAEHHHPAYDEQAWAKMEKLLNKHLPQKEDRRRRFLFFLLLFSGLAGAGLIIAKPWKNNKKMAATEQNVQQQQAVNLPSDTEPGKEKTNIDDAVEINDDTKNSTETGSKNSVTDLSVISQPVVLNGNKNSNQNISKDKSVIKQLDIKTKNVQPIITAGMQSRWQNNDTKDKTDDNGTTAPVAIATTSIPVKDVISSDKKKNETVVADKATDANTSPVANESVKSATSKNESEPVEKNNGLKKSNKKNSKGNSLFYTLSTGPDVSFVNNDKLGTTKLMAGGGLGYTFKNRFTLRTGFYSGRKIYSASPDAYHPPANFYTYYPYLEKVDADCKVYEIPISLSYNFSKSAKQSLFATAGISSYLMKEETYNYTYKYTPSGPSYSRKKTLKNENKHLFSALTLSGGYQRNLSKHISFMVEPYVKLPLSGIGYGRVKLNSGGVLFSIGIKPFATKKGKSVTNR